MRRAISRLDRNKDKRSEYGDFFGHNDIDICLNDVPDKNRNEAFAFMREHFSVKNVGMTEIEPEHYHLTANVESRL